MSAFNDLAVKAGDRGANALNRNSVFVAEDRVLVFEPRVRRESLVVGVHVVRGARVATARCRGRRVKVGDGIWGTEKVGELLKPRSGGDGSSRCALTSARVFSQAFEGRHMSRRRRYGERQNVVGRCGVIRVINYIGEGRIKGAAVGVGVGVGGGKV